ncbi:MAG: hypothetical protein LC624_06875 [Halobacteriales archaeon]|nr:hypothetical protein [Halobacteriales archaeon]
MSRGYSSEEAQERLQRAREEKERERALAAEPQRKRKLPPGAVEEPR